MPHISFNAPTVRDPALETSRATDAPSSRLAAMLSNATPAPSNFVSRNPSNATSMAWKNASTSVKLKWIANSATIIVGVKNLTEAGINIAAQSGYINVTADQANALSKALGYAVHVGRVYYHYKS